MERKYTRQELNEILFSKKLDDFYLAIIENRQELLTDEEYNEIISRDNEIYGDNKEEVQDLLDKVKNNSQTKNIASELTKMIYSLARIRHLAILTRIDDEIYDIGNAKFEDLKRNKIVCFANFTDYYDDRNARLKYFTPEEEPRLKETTVLMDVSDTKNIDEFEKNVYQDNSEDLTEMFYIEISNSKYTKKRTK